MILVSVSTARTSLLPTLLMVVMTATVTSIHFDRPVKYAQIMRPRLRATSGGICRNCDSRSVGRRSYTSTHVADIRTLGTARRSAHCQHWANVLRLRGRPEVATRWRQRYRRRRRRRLAEIRGAAETLVGGNQAESLAENNSDRQPSGRQLYKLEPEMRHHRRHTWPTTVTKLRLRLPVEVRLSVGAGYRLSVGRWTGS